jgi:hypothetical protein
VPKSLIEKLRIADRMKSLLAKASDLVAPVLEGLAKVSIMGEVNGAL